MPKKTEETPPAPKPEAQKQKKDERRLREVESRLEELRGISSYFNEPELEKQIQALEEEKALLQKAAPASSGAPEVSAMTEEKALLHNKIKQNLLYLKKGKMDIEEGRTEAGKAKLVIAARELEVMVQEPQNPGARDPLAWTALGRVYQAQGKFEEMAACFETALQTDRQELLIEETKWAKKAIETFQQNLGQVVIDVPPDWKGPETLDFAIKLRAPLFDQNRQNFYTALTASASGNVLTRKVDQPFYLPVGKFEIGGREITVDAGVEAKIPISEITPAAPKTTPETQPSTVAGLEE